MRENLFAQVSSHKVIQNLRWGIFWGLCGAAVYCAWVGILFLLRGAAPFLANGTTFPATLAAYLVGGLGAGIILGLLRPFTRMVWGVALVGFLCALPVWFGALGAVEGFQRIDGADVRVMVFLAFATGPLCAFLARRRLKDWS